MASTTDQESISRLLQNGNTDQARRRVRDKLQNQPDPDTFHRPLMKAAMECGHPEFGECLIQDLNPEDHINLVQQVRKGITADLGWRLFPEEIDIIDWWDGPHLFSETSEMMTWMPAQVQKAESGMLHLEVVKRSHQGEIEKKTIVVSQREVESSTGEDIQTGDVLFDRLEVLILMDGGMDFQFYD